MCRDVSEATNRTILGERGNHVEVTNWNGPLASPNAPCGSLVKRPAKPDGLGHWHSRLSKTNACDKCNGQVGQSGNCLCLCLSRRLVVCKCTLQITKSLSCLSLEFENCYEINDRILAIARLLRAQLCFQWLSSFESIAQCLVCLYLQ